MMASTQQCAPGLRNASCHPTGCLLEDGLCGTSEACVNDGMFGRCQKVPGLDISRYEVSPVALQHLRATLQALSRTGFMWQEDDTQRIMAQELAGLLRAHPQHMETSSPARVSQQNVDTERQYSLENDVALAKTLQRYLPYLEGLSHTMALNAHQGMVHEKLPAKGELPFPENILSYVAHKSALTYPPETRAQNPKAFPLRTISQLQPDQLSPKADSSVDRQHLMEALGTYTVRMPPALAREGDPGPRYILRSPSRAPRPLSALAPPQKWLSAPGDTQQPLSTGNGVLVPSLLKDLRRQQADVEHGAPIGLEGMADVIAVATARQGSRAWEDDSPGSSEEFPFCQVNHLSVPPGDLLEDHGSPLLPGEHPLEKSFPTEIKKSEEPVASLSSEEEDVGVENVKSQTYSKDFLEKANAEPRATGLGGLQSWDPGALQDVQSPQAGAQVPPGGGLQLEARPSEGEELGYIVTDTDPLSPEKGRQLMEDVARLLQVPPNIFEDIDVLGPAVTFKVGANVRNVTTADVARATADHKNQLADTSELKILQSGTGPGLQPQGSYVVSESLHCVASLQQIRPGDAGQTGACQCLTIAESRSLSVSVHSTLGLWFAQFGCCHLTNLPFSITEGENLLHKVTGQQTLTCSEQRAGPPAGTRGHQVSAVTERGGFGLVSVSTDRGAGQSGYGEWLCAPVVLGDTDSARPHALHLSALSSKLKLLPHRGDQEDSTKFIVLTFLSMACIVGVLLASSLIYCLRHSSHHKLKKKLSGLGGDPSADATAAYQELCRQHMAVRLPDRPEGPHASRISSVSSQFSDGPMPSPSARSSTSSWSEEPVQSNMDISTGHMILAYMEDHLQNKNRLEKEWEALCAYQAEPSSSLAAQREENLAKNRCPAVLTYDHSRILLKAENSHGNSDYINASPIMDHDPRNPAYITTQGPLPATVADFWQMVWESGCAVIVMLTPLTENGVRQCHHYWPDEGSNLYHIYEVNLVSEHIWCEDFLVRSFYLKNLQTHETRTVTQFHFLSWYDQGVPSSTRSLLDFRRKVNKCYRGRSCPIIVHCSDGAGRSGTYILIDMVLNKMAKGAKEIDIAATLEHLRDQRPGMVQTKEQFEFALTAVAEEVNAILRALPQ
ncbi:Receptor-type tyrosine-protein phosphatase N2 [Heterocephalus glaber]|uniref:Receptor-type tyrosine-protein phosphatase N2 n=1 Tax=Heterocephalus glaber TaxID=10181 RepID=G5C8S2_HETGA|nr:Receptor-type tyrosine-protein phosphatase N2 [Heterocephalus glaber]